MSRQMITFMLVVATTLVGTQTAPGASSIPVFQGCAPTKPSVRPSQVTVACADANFFLAGLKWSRWDGSGADAVGTAHQNDCRPYCAAGHFHTYPVVVRLSRAETCSNGRREFTRFYYRFTRSKPPGQARLSSTIASPFYVRSGCP